MKEEISIAVFLEDMKGYLYDILLEDFEEMDSLR